MASMWESQVTTSALVSDGTPTDSLMHVYINHTYRQKLMLQNCPETHRVVYHWSLYMPGFLSKWTVVVRINCNLDQTLCWQQERNTGLITVHTKWDVCRDFSNLVTVWKRYIYTSQRSSVRTWKKLPQAEGNLKH